VIIHELPYRLFGRHEITCESTPVIYKYSGLELANHLEKVLSVPVLRGGESSPAPKQPLTTASKNQTPPIFFIRNIPLSPVLKFNSGFYLTGFQQDTSTPLPTQSKSISLLSLRPPICHCDCPPVIASAAKQSQLFNLHSVIATPCVIASATKQSQLFNLHSVIATPRVIASAAKQSQLFNLHSVIATPRVIASATKQSQLFNLHSVIATPRVIASAAKQSQLFNLHSVIATPRVIASAAKQSQLFVFSPAHLFHCSPALFRHSRPYLSPLRKQGSIFSFPFNRIITVWLNFLKSR